MLKGVLGQWFANYAKLHPAARTGRVELPKAPPNTRTRDADWHQLAITRLSSDMPLAMALTVTARWKDDPTFVQAAGFRPVGDSLENYPAQLMAGSDIAVSEDLYAASTSGGRIRVEYGTDAGSHVADFDVRSGTYLIPPSAEVTVKVKRYNLFLAAGDEAPTIIITASLAPWAPGMVPSECVLTAASGVMIDAAAGGRNFPVPPRADALRYGVLQSSARLHKVTSTSGPLGGGAFMNFETRFTGGDQASQNLVAGKTSGWCALTQVSQHGFAAGINVGVSGSNEAGQLAFRIAL